MGDDDFWLVVEQNIQGFEEYIQNLIFPDEHFLKRHTLGKSLNNAGLLAPYNHAYITRPPKGEGNIAMVNAILNGHGIEIGSPKKNNDTKLLICQNDIGDLKADFELLKKSSKNQKITPEFFSVWTRVNRNMAVLMHILDDLAPNEFNNAHKADSILAQKYWYVLWIENFRNTNPDLNRRNLATHALGTTIFEIAAKIRISDKKIDNEWFIEWLKPMLSKDKDKSLKPHISSGFVRDIKSADWQNWLVEAKSLKKYLPPVGIDKYPMKK